MQNQWWVLPSIFLPVILSSTAMTILFFSVIAQLSSLTTANKNLRTELFILEQHYNEAMAKAGAMSFTTRGTIHKGLQPESSGEARDAARKAFNGFCDDQKRAGPTKRHS